MFSQTRLSIIAWWIQVLWQPLHPGETQTSDMFHTLEIQALTREGITAEELIAILSSQAHGGGLIIIQICDRDQVGLQVQ